MDAGHITDLFGAPMPGDMERSAVFSACRRYRYALWRRWGPGPYCMFVGLNPSTADELLDDPTIRRCIGFARSWGYDALCMTNLFAFRATDPAVMKAADEPVGPDNDMHLKSLAGGAGVVVAAWGVHGTFMGRHLVAREQLSGLHFLRLTRDGYPGHPLYLPADLAPTPWAATGT